MADLLGELLGGLREDTAGTGREHLVQKPTQKFLTGVRTRARAGKETVDLQATETLRRRIKGVNRTTGTLGTPLSKHVHCGTPRRGGEGRQRWAERVSEEIMNENFSNFVKDTILHIQEIQPTASKRGPWTHQTHYNLTVKGKTERLLKSSKTDLSHTRNPQEDYQQPLHQTPRRPESSG